MITEEKIRNKIREIRKIVDTCIKDVYSLSDAYRCPICTHYSPAKAGKPSVCNSTIGCSKANIRCGFEYREIPKTKKIVDDDATGNINENETEG